VAGGEIAGGAGGVWKIGRGDLSGPGRGKGCWRTGRVLGGVVDGSGGEGPERAGLMIGSIGGNMVEGDQSVEVGGMVWKMEQGSDVAFGLVLPLCHKFFEDVLFLCRLLRRVDAVFVLLRRSPGSDALLPVVRVRLGVFAPVGLGMRNLEC